MKPASFAIAASLLAAVSSHGAVTTIKTSDGNGADTIVIGGTNANTNYGANSSLLIKNVSPVNGFTRKDYLRFDLSSFTGTITDASLKLTVADNNNGTAGVSSSFNVAVYGLNDNVVGQGWSESIITWNNAPGNTNSGSTFDAQATVLLGNLTVTTSDVGGSVVTFSSSSLLGFLAADTDNLVTIMLARTDLRTGENLAFLSKEANQGASAPSLVVTTAVPEPATLGLLALSGCCVALVRRRSMAVR